MVIRLFIHWQHPVVNTRGTGMVDTKLNGDGDYQQEYINTDDYRSQEFPNGSAVTISTYNLRITKT
jgi:hypothetical protein